MSEPAAAPGDSLLAWKLAGEGPGAPLLLLNGGLMTIPAWDPVAAPLEERRRVLRCDFRGQLLSPGEPEPRMEAHVADVVALLDHLGIERVHAAGASFGGFAAVLLAATHPERVASLAAITTAERVTPEVWAGTAEIRQAALDAAAGSGDGGRVLDLLLPTTYTPGFLEAHRDRFDFQRRWVAARPPIWLLGLARLLEALEGLDLAPALSRVECPALILAAEDDAVFPPERARALAANLPGARLEVLPGGCHGLVAEQPERVVESLERFLSSLPTP